MRASRLLAYGLLCAGLVMTTSAIEPVTMMVAGGIGVASMMAAGWWEPIRCRVTSCCNDRWVIKNFTGFAHALNYKLHGQHLATSLITAHVTKHMSTNDPSKALVLSLHGPTGVGKTFVSKMLVENMYKDGMHSPFVHLTSAIRDFPHGSDLSKYKEHLRSWIRTNVKKCERSMFIFEEADKLPAGLLDTLVPFIYLTDDNGVDYRKAIFIFLSNTGSSNIVKIAVDHWMSGNNRHALSLSELQEAIRKAINEDKDYGLWQSRLVSENLINTFVPFLPLERSHVSECIRDALLAGWHRQDLYSLSLSSRTKEILRISEEVMKLLTFLPAEQPLFAEMGCKKAIQKILLVI